MITPGLMADLAAAARGSLKLAICTGSGVKMLQDEADDGSQPADPRRDQILCPYAAFGDVPTAADPVRLIIFEFEAAFEASVHRRILLLGPASGHCHVAEQKRQVLRIQA